MAESSLMVYGIVIGIAIVLGIVIFTIRDKSRSNAVSASQYKADVGDEP